MITNVAVSKPACREHLLLEDFPHDLHHPFGKKLGSLETAGKSYMIHLDVHHKGSNWDKTHSQLTIVTTQLLNHCCEAYKSSK